MPGKVTIKITGAAELERALQELGPRVARNASGRALRAMAKPIVKRARELVPVVTGRLRKSITAYLDRVQTGERTIRIGFKKPTSRRAHLTEYGTVHAPARPFMRPALDEQAIWAFDEMGRVLGDAIEKEAVKRGAIGEGDTGEGEVTV